MDSLARKPVGGRQAVATSIFALLLGAGIGAGISLAWAIPLGIAVVALVSLSDVAILGTALLTSCFLVHPYALNIVSVGGFSLSVGEAGALISLLSALLSAVLRPLERFKIGGTDWAMLGFVASVAIGLVVSSAAGVPARAGLLTARVYVFLAVYFAARIVFQRPNAKQKLFGLIAGMVVTAATASIAQSLLGSAVKVFVVGNVPEFLQADAAYGLVRVRPPSLTLSYVALCFALAFLLYGGPRRLKWVAVTVLLAATVAVAISLNRNMVLGATAGVLVVLALSQAWGRLGRLLALGLSALVAVVAPLWPYLSGLGVFQRVLSIGDYDALTAGTLADRFYENALALGTLSAHPIVGIGWGTSYGATYTYSVNGVPTSDPRLWIHNQYLGIWLRTGLFGLGFFILALLLTFVRGLGWARSKSEDCWIGAGVAIAVVALSSSALVGMYFSYGDSLVPLCLVLAAGQPLAAACESGNEEDHVVE